MLPIVLVVGFVLGAMVIAIANFGTANLRYGRVTERRSHQLAAADAAMTYAVNLIRTRAAECIYTGGTVDLPDIDETFNDATGEVSCDLQGGGLDSAGLFAMVLTAEGVPTSTYVVQTQGGDIKRLGGPLFMERVTPAATFDLANDKGLLIEGAPLVHYDGSSPDCVSIDESVLDPDVRFEPDSLFGPLCTSSRWYNYGPGGTTFDEPPINTDLSARSTLNAGGMRVFRGDLADTGSAISTLRYDADPADQVQIWGGFNDTLYPGCRVFYPGRYVRPPAVASGGSGQRPVYFFSGDYLFDFRTASGTPTSFVSWAGATGASAEFVVNKALITAGRLDPALGIAEGLSNPGCDAARAADGGLGATFYLARSSQFAIDTQGEIEIMPRNQGTPTNPIYVSIHAICNQATHPLWCTQSPSSVTPSDRLAPSSTANPALVWIKAGNNSEIVTDGLIYAPLAEMEFANVSNDAIVRIRGGMVVARATIHASASAENFEIGVGSQDVDLELRLTATGTDVDGGTTEITSQVDLHYDEEMLDDRVDVLTWRVCEGTSC